MLFFSVILMDILTGMEFDLFVPAFPQLQSHFGLVPFWVEALLSVNFAGYCLSLFFVGALADRYGRKPIIVLGLVTFVLGSVLCLSVDSFSVLLLGRFLQGLGIAAPAILSFLIIADCYPLKQQQFLLALLNGSMNLAVAIAPVIGSYLTLYFHWQGNFVALLALGLIALVMVLLVVPKSSRAQSKEELSLQGYVVIFKSKPLMLLMLSLVVLCVPYWVFVGMSPLLYMTNLGVSLAHFGYYQGVLAFAFAVGCVVFAVVIKRRWMVDQRKMLKLTNVILVLSFVGVAWMAFLEAGHPLLITLAVLCFVIGQIIPSVILYPLCLSFMPEVKGRISALIQAGRLVFTAVSLELAGYFYNGSFESVGILMLIFIGLGVVGLFFIIKNRDLMRQLS